VERHWVAADSGEFGDPAPLSALHITTRTGLRSNGAE